MNHLTVSRAGGLLLLVFTVAGCSDRLPGKPGIDELPVTANQVTNSTKLYRDNCAACHGEDGLLGPAPPLNDPLFLAIVTEEDIQRTLIEGRHGTAMPSFVANPKLPGIDPATVPSIARTPFALTPYQISILVKRITLWKADQGSKLPSYRARGVKGSVARGKEVFKRACAVCHGEDGKAEKLEINDPNFLALISVQALRRIVITGRPDLGMPSYRDKDKRGDDFKPLTDQEIDDLQTLLASWKQGSDEGK